MPRCVGNILVLISRGNTKRANSVAGNSHVDSVEGWNFVSNGYKDAFLVQFCRTVLSRSELWDFPGSLEITHVEVLFGEGKDRLLLTFLGL